MPLPDSDAPFNSELPLRIGTEEDFAAVSRLFREVGYEEERLCRIFKLSHLHEFAKIMEADFSTSSVEPALLGILIKVFFLVEPVAVQELEALIPSSAFKALWALDLLRPIGEEEGRPSSGPHLCRSTVWLYPSHGLLLVSDRTRQHTDAVFPALSPLTYRFLQRIGREPAEATLDLCSGCGVAALTLSSHSQRVVAADISERAVHFAGFNCRLNGKPNVVAVASDLYSAFEGQTFQKIVAHPPYVPSLSNETIWRDGGETGEMPIRRIVAGLNRFLVPGGRFYASCGGFDTEEASFEERVRSWLGSAQEEWDVIFALEFDKSPWHLAKEAANPGPDKQPERTLRMLQCFHQLRATEFVTGALMIHRRLRPVVPPAKPLTRRTQLSPISDGRSFEWWLRYLSWLEAFESLQQFSQLKPRVSPHLAIRITHRVQEQELAPVEFLLESSWPFRTETQVDARILQTLLKCDGSRTFADLFATAADLSLLPPGYQLSDFLQFGLKMIERGYLTVEELLPA
ncbi:MAG: methyltransferase [Acidobacteriota bacterium]